MTETTRPSAERVATIAGLAAVTLLAWLYVVHLARDMAPMDAMSMPHAASWTVRDALFALVMWSVMMVAMMTPSAAPMVLTYDRLTRAGPAARGSRATTAAFLAGYLIVWAAFSVGATALQWALQSIGAMSPHAMRAAPALGGALFVVAGIWQLSPLRNACLAQCRSPMSFLMAEWRDGAAGALRMGLRHGLFCVGCCWALMLVLFAAGVMNLAWIALLSVWVLIEKTMPAGAWLSRIGGALAIGWGVWLLARAGGA